MIAIAAPQKTDFSKNVIRIVQRVPAGKVATYGQIARLAGKEQGSRGVAWLLSSSSHAHHLPWHRILNAQGRISFPAGSKQFREQKRRLESEGVVLDTEGRLDLKKFGWNKKVKPKAVPKNRPKMFSEGG